MWTTLKVFIEFVSMLLLFYLLFSGWEARGILAPNQGSNPNPLHWKAKPQPLDHQGIPIYKFLSTKYCVRAVSRKLEYTYELK